MTKTVGICIATIEGGAACHQEIGREASRRGLAYPEIVTHTPRYAHIRRAVENDDFTGLADALNDLMGVLHRAGADLAIIPSNTMHVVFDEVAKRSPVPLLNIAAVAGDYCRGRGFRRIGIMGTAATIRRRLLDPYLREGDALPVYPSPADQEVLGTIIAQELVRGIFKPASINLLLGIASRLRENADAIILGCTELPLVITRENCDAPLIDTTRLLAHAAPDVALHPSDLLSRGS